MSQTKPQVHHVDGPMLPHLNHFSVQSKDKDDAGKEVVLPRATTSLVPILTPPISNSGDNDADNSHQYLLIPNPKRIVVRSAHHGKRVCDLTIPAVDGVGVTIRAVKLAWLPRLNKQQAGEEDSDDDEDEEESNNGGNDDEDGEWVILAGCSNGTLHEWSITDLSVSSSSSLPRRSFQLTCLGMKDLDLIHLTSASNTEDTSKLLAASNSDGSAVLYGLVKGRIANSESKKGKKGGAVIATWLVRINITPFVVPSANGENQKKLSSLPVQTLVPVKSATTKTGMDDEKSSSQNNNHVVLKKKDCIFGLMAAYRPSSKTNDSDRMDYMVDNEDDNNTAAPSGGVFVVMCASHSLAIYRDSLNIQSDDASSNNLVHFNKSTKSSSQYYTADQMAFSSLAISPDVKDLALGRVNGHIEVLDGVFENVAAYLNQKMGNKNDTTEELQLQHPEEVTVKRNVHWHAHPVRALAFLTAYGRRNNKTSGGNNPSSLLSGGEESVLVTWQLDRNFHKPSNFIARVGQGGIIHTLACQYTGKVLVFCSDNSIQCYNGSNYERDWSEQGLASMALLHEEEDKEEEETKPSRGPIIMVKDPITNFPMLTNLPGAPGMVHWYDPKSASVAGTLEVAPYNRVSRRDPTSDPHIPAPAVTHMAVGQSGKDMVTVDTVWTENTSVGSSYDLAAPQGGTTIPMNVCTSIKFWSYVESSKGGKTDQRKRRNGDVPMNYELVSCMAAPHGREGEVCALAVAPNGRVACTLSQEEDAFRVWVKNTDTSTGAGVGSTLWKCLYKVKTPSGYANLLSQRVSSPSLGQQQLVSFSSDGTVLSVSYGPHVTLWDHSNATLLTSVTLGDSDIQTVGFLTRNDDMMLLTTASQIGVKSPFGGVKSCYLGEDEWSLDAGSFGKEALVSAVVPLHDFKGGKRGAAGGGFFAVSITLNNGFKSLISIISRDEGGSVVCAEGTDNTPIQWQVDGEVQSICVERSRATSASIQLLALTKDCQMFSLSCGSDGQTTRKGLSVGVQSARGARAHQAPVLKTGTDAAAEAAAESSSTKRRKVSIGISRGGSENGRSVSGFEFPALSGKFTSAFIAQSLGKRSN